MGTFSNIAGILPRNLAICVFGVISFDRAIGNRGSSSDETYYLGAAAIGIAFTVLYTIYGLCRRQDAGAEWRSDVVAGDGIVPPKELPYFELENDTRAQFARIKQSQKRKFFSGTLTFGAIVIFLIFIEWSEEFFGVEFSSIAIFGLIAVWFGLAYLATKFFDSSLHEVLICPHCEREFEIIADWICGWCGHTNSGEKFLKSLSSRRIYEECGHSACKMEPIAIRCRYKDCGNDIVVDSGSYSTETKCETRDIRGVGIFTQPTPASTPPGTRSRLDRGIS